MPDFKKHCESCERKYGESYEEVHRWMDEPIEVMGPSHRKYRHNIHETPNFVKRMWNEKLKKGLTNITGDEAREACIDHILLDMDAGDLPETPLKPKGIKICPVPEPSIRELDNKVKEKLEKFLHSKEILNELRKIAVAGQKSLVVGFEQLLKFDMDLAKSISDCPDDFLGAAAAVLEGITKVPGMRLCVRGLDKSIEIHNICAGDVGKFIQVEGILVRASNPKTGIREAVFKCLRCGEENRVLQTDEALKEPFVCENPNCGKKGSFLFLKESSEFYEWQILRIQENTNKGGTFLDAVLKDDLVDRAWLSSLGSLVRVNGILKFSSGKHEFHKVLDIKYLKILRPELSSEDKRKIKELAKDPWLREKVIQSIAPTIYGNKSIKEAIALQLFGSSSLKFSFKDLRGNIHILLIGDPSTAKSDLLKWAAWIAPNGFYIFGSAGTKLTPTVVRDEISGGWILEAGALAIANDGFVSIDEFEKINLKDANAVLESLECQAITINKAGIVATLNTSSALLAAASPKLGRFEKNLTIAQQVPLDPVILSRFDLVFVMLDEPRVDQDRTIAHHILEMQRPPTKVKPPLSTDFLRKIIIYARQNLDPKLDNKEVMKTIEDFFVGWRRVAKRGEAPLPITVRQLEAIVRLAKANARMRLSDRVTVEDANRAIMLVKRSLQEVGIDIKTGRLDIDVLMTGKAKSQRDNIRRVLDIIKELEGQYGGAAPVEEIKRIAESDGIKQSFVEELIEEEKDRGHLYEPKQGMLTRAVK